MATRVDPARFESVVGLRPTGTGARRELRCAACGYGASLAGEPPPCPMCRGTVWDPAAWRPFTALAAIMGLENGSTWRRRL
jgi:hypothetical protein